MTELKCNKCENKASYSEKYDVYYCKNCNIWLEKKCSDSNCEFCTNRPDSPREADNEECGYFQKGNNHLEEAGDD